METKKHLLALAVTVCFISKGFCDFYVDKNNGNDLWDGSALTPWKTIQNACDNATSGSTVFIKAATYYENLSMNISGTAGNYITFRNYQNDVVTVDGNNATGVLLDITNQSYIKIIGLNFANCVGNNSEGIYISGTSHHIEITRNKIYNIHFSSNPGAPVNSNTNANPFLAWGDNASTSIKHILVDSNEIYNCRTGYSEALTMDGNVDTFEVSYNKVHDITNIGILAAGNYGVCSTPANDQARHGSIKWNTVYNCISAYATSGGIYVDGGTYVTIENNNIRHCGYGVEVGCEVIGKTSSYVTVRNNLMYNNEQSAIALGGYNYPSGSGKVTNTKFLNNTCFNNDTTNSGMGEIAITYSENCMLKNNIFYAGSSNNFMTNELNSTGLSLDYNLYYSAGGTGSAKFSWNGTLYTGFANYKTGAGKDANSSFANPQFVSNSASNPNLHITTSSPAKNAGDPAFVPASNEKDIDNEVRVNEAIVDIGADEYYTSSTILVLNKTNEINAYPNPVSDKLTIDLGKVNFEKANVKITDISGKEIYNSVVTGNSCENIIDFSQYRSGLYILNLNIDGNMDNIKVIKK